jgi:hypothetical protein
MAEDIAESVLPAIRKPHVRCLQILKSAEDAEDHATALHAVRECRRTPN